VGQRQDDLLGSRAALLLGAEIVGRVPGIFGHRARVLNRLRLAGVAAKRLHAHPFALDPVAPRLQEAGQVVVGLVERALLVAGQGEVHLAIGERVLRQMEQVLLHALGIDRADRAPDGRIDLPVAPDSLPARLVRAWLVFGRAGRTRSPGQRDKHQAQNRDSHASHGMILECRGFSAPIQSRTLPRITRSTCRSRRGNSADGTATLGALAPLGGALVR